MMSAVMRVLIALLLVPCTLFSESVPQKPTPPKQTQNQSVKKKKSPQKKKKTQKKAVAKQTAPQKNVKAAAQQVKKIVAPAQKKPTPPTKKIAPAVSTTPAETVITTTHQLPEAITQAPALAPLDVTPTNTDSCEEALATTETVLLPVEEHALITTPTATIPVAPALPKKEKAQFEEIPVPESLSRQPAVSIRLLLHEFDASKEAVYEVSSPQAVFIQDPDVSEHVYLHRHHNLKVSIKDERLFVSTTTGLTRRLKKNHVVLHPVGGHLSINGTIYCGTVSLVIDPTSKKLLFVNSIDLEDYVYSVLACESGIMWDHEVQKVQAIATRSYAIHHKLQNLKSKNGKYYDLKTSNFHQVYRGHHKYSRLRPAVTETAGQVVTHNGDVALTMFDACCGGSIPANRKRPNLSSTPHLQRKKACNYCSNFSLYNWEYTLTADEIMAQLYNHPLFKKKFTAFGKLKDIKITDKDKAGATYKVTMVGTRKNVPLTTRELMSCLKKYLWSASFKIAKHGDEFTIKGNGYGHQLGLCQHGARELVRQGWNYHAILAFYYPKTAIKHIAAFSGKKVIFS